VHIYMKNNIPAKFHLDPIWNYGASGFSPQQEEEQDE